MVKIKRLFVALCLLWLMVATASAANLTASQLTVLKADILADPVLSAYPQTADGLQAIAAAYNVNAAPAFWVWRTRITEEEIVGEASPDGTLWSWPAYISRSAGEQNCWSRMFAKTEGINASRPNVRQGLADIFSGPSGVAQRTHLLAIGRRLSTRAEKLFATGTGSTASPGTMTFEGTITVSDVIAAFNA